jgi:hypothetical protein
LVGVRGTTKIAPNAIHEDKPMKLLALATGLVVAIAVAAPAEAASKKKPKRVAVQQQATTVSQDPYMVRTSDGEALGADPDPFIRMMIRKEGRIRDQSGI